MKVFTRFKGLQTPFLPQHYTVDYNSMLFEKFKFVSHKVLDMKPRMARQKQVQHQKMQDFQPPKRSFGYDLHSVVHFPRLTQNYLHAHRSPMPSFLLMQYHLHQSKSKCVIDRFWISVFLFSRVFTPWTARVPPQFRQNS